MTTWFPVKLKKQFTNFEALNRAVNLYVRFKEEDEKFIVWDGYLDYEYISVDDAITHLQSERDNEGKPVKIQTEELDLQWFKCIYQNNDK